jgi:hypothetical protein
VKVALCSCQFEKKKEGFKKAKADYKITQLGELPAALNESSGLAQGSSKNTYWTHNDSGNAAELYLVNKKGELEETLTLSNLKNDDWEDLAQDNKGNLYIADVGNNAHDRRDLKIYKIRPDSPQTYETISLRYADQQAFPSPVRNFDCEAVAWHGGKLYLFSKNWSQTNHTVKLYALPDKAGEYTLWPQDSTQIKTMVTGADVSPDGRTLALMTYGKVVLYDISGGVNFNKPLDCIKTAHGQTEAILFVNNTDFVFTNEKKRSLYLAKKKK